MTLLGDCYAYGEGIAKDEARAVELYRQADEQGLRLDKDKFSTALLALLRTKTDFSGVRGVSEGLENRLYRSAQMPWHC